MRAECVLPEPLLTEINADSRKKLILESGISLEGRRQLRIGHRTNNETVSYMSIESQGRQVTELRVLLQHVD
jgi:hypothetical protein